MHIDAFNELVPLRMQTCKKVSFFRVLSHVVKKSFKFARANNMRTCDWLMKGKSLSGSDRLLAKNNENLSTVSHVTQRKTFPTSWFKLIQERAKLHRSNGSHLFSRDCFSWLSQELELLLAPELQSCRAVMPTTWSFPHACNWVLIYVISRGVFPHRKPRIRGSGKWARTKTCYGSSGGPIYHLFVRL